MKGKRGANSQKFRFWGNINGFQVAFLPYLCSAKEGALTPLVCWRTHCPPPSHKKSTMTKRKKNMRLLPLWAAALLFTPATLDAQQPGGVLTVDELFNLVEENSRSLQVAKRGLEAAGHGVAAAKSERLPEIGVELSISYYGNVIQTDRDFTNVIGFSTPHFGNSFTLAAEQAIYTGGALSAGITLAEIGEQQAANGILATRQAQRFRAMAQYLELMEADNALRVYERNIELTGRLIADIEAKRAQGMALRNDITRYELQMETLQLGKRKMEDQRNILNHQLCNTLGLETNTLILPDTTLMQPSPLEQEADWQGKALALSPSMTSAELGTQAAAAQLKLARSEQLPHIGLFAVDNFSGPYNYDLPPIDKNYNVWQVGIGVSYSLSSLFKANKRVRQNKALVQQSQEAFDEAAEGLDNRVHEAHTLYLQAFANLRTRQKSAQLARENYEVVNERYLNDLALITDMTDASNMRLSAELDETNARIQIVFAYYRMKYVAGDI